MTDIPVALWMAGLAVFVFLAYWWLRFMDWLDGIIFPARWERRALIIRAQYHEDAARWTVGRLDMRNFNVDTGEPEYYAYGPNGEKVGFTGAGRLRRAVLYVEKQNDA